MTHYPLDPLTHLVAASLAVQAFPARDNLLRDRMVPDLETMLLSSTWNESVIFMSACVSGEVFMTEFMQS